jgi:nicotinate phosphoribosyltransferase
VPRSGSEAASLLFTDLYQLTMAQAYRRHGLHERRVQFDVFFRELPDYGAHQAGYAVAAGLADLLGWMTDARLAPDDEARLRDLRTAAGAPLFDDGFLTWLRAQRGFADVTVRAVPEGRVIHAEAPFAIVEAPLAVAQVLETPVLNHLNYPTLVATRAARLRHAAGGQALLEFGMRRGHGQAVDAGARAALIGGVDASSNTGASLRLGVPPRGTHAHSFVQVFMATGGSELDAFRAYAEVYPDDCLLLLDTVDTLGSGLPNAITVFEELRSQGHEPQGVRLDSGDLAYLAVRAARELDAAGFPRAIITLSNQLDELTIWQIRQQIADEARETGVDADAVIGRLAFGVGTRLITSRGACALDGVYKLVAVHHDGRWQPSSKRSDTPEKATIPGPKSLHRVYDARGMATADLIALADERPQVGEALTLHHPRDERERTLTAEGVTGIEPLLEVAWSAGATAGPPVDVAELRRRREADEARLDVGVKRLRHPHRYHVSLTERLWRLKGTVTSG